MGKVLPDYQSMFESSPDLYLILGPDLTIINASDAYLNATMVKRDDIIGHNIFAIFPDNPESPNPASISSFQASIQRVLQFQIPDTMAVQKYDIRRPQQEGGRYEEHFWSIINSPVLDQDNKVKYIIHRVEDVTELLKLKQIGEVQNKLTEELRSKSGKMEYEVYQRAQQIQEVNEKLRAAESELQELAYFDVLTGLSNRTHLIQQMEQAIANASCHHWQVVVLYLDIDHFKFVNDTLGHDAGDMLLQVISKRLSDIIRKNDMIARIGGDEFVIFLNGVDDTFDSAKVARRILASIREPVILDDHKLFVTGSIGISKFPENGTDEKSLLKHADIAMYRAKQLGRNNYQFCTAEIERRMQEKMNLENELHNALDQNRFILHYQPQIDLKTGRIFGLEALLRLQKTDGTLLAPNEFLGVAEETGLIVPISEWIIYTVCMQYQTWINEQFRQFNMETPPVISVNISTQHLLQNDFLPQIRHIIDKTQIDPACLGIEITENPVITDINAGAENIQFLKDMKVIIALDDFGIGFSSLNYLRKFPVDFVKIDCSLIHHITTNEREAALVRSLIRMAHSIGIETIAEGVETEEQLQLLVTAHCDKIQGFIFAKPMPAAEVTDFMASFKWPSIAR